MSYTGTTIALYGDSGSGKTTQGGELAKRVWKNRKKRTRLNTADRGGYKSIDPLVNLGIVKVNELGQDDDPWIWINSAVTGGDEDPEIGLEIFDSGTSISDNLLAAAAHSTFQVGQRPVQKFTVSKGEKNLVVPSNTDAHYGVIQSFMLEAIRKSTWLTRRGVDVLWTFAVLRSEEQDRTTILGPKLAGKALTPVLPKEFIYTFRLASLPQDGAAPIHRLYLAEYPEMSGLGHGFGNARYPLGVGDLPPYVEPASLPGALDLIEEGAARAEESLRIELGL